MSYKNFHIFLHLSESANIHDTAKHFRVSPQYISRSIAQLESSYGVKLFFRTPSLRLTYEGEQVLSAAREIFLYESNIQNELTDLRAVKGSALRLGCVGGVAQLMLPHVLKHYNKSYPSVRIQLYEDCSSESLQQMLAASTLDLGIDVQTPLLLGNEQINLSNEPIRLLVSSSLLREHFNDYPLCIESFSRGIDLSRFLSLPFLKNLNESYLYQSLEAYAQKYKMKPSYAFFSHSTELLINLCHSGLGVLLCPACYTRLIANLGDAYGNYLLSFPVTDSFESYQLKLIYASDRYIPQYVKFFVYTAQRFFRGQTLSLEEYDDG